MEFLIDIGRLLDVLVKRWKLVVLLPLVSGVIVGVGFLLMPPSYVASGMIVVRGSEFDEAELEREVALLQEWGRSPLVASRILRGEDVGFQSSLVSVEDLLGAVTAKVPTGSNALTVSVRSKDVSEASHLAGAWINQVLQLATMGDADGKEEKVFDAAVASARQNLDASSLRYQEALTVGSLYSVQAEREMLEDSIATLTAERQQRLEGAIQDRVSLERNLLAARGLESQVRSGGAGAAASSWLALVDLKLGAYASGGTKSGEDATDSLGAVIYQVAGPAPSVSVSETQQDLDSLVRELESRLVRSDAVLVGYNQYRFKDDMATDAEDSDYWVRADTALTEMLDYHGVLDAKVAESEHAIAAEA